MDDEKQHTYPARSSDCLSNAEHETYAQYSLRTARETRLQKEAIAREAMERKRQKKHKRIEQLRQARKSRKQISPNLLALAQVTNNELIEKAKAEAAKAEEIKQRRKHGLCICCGDDKDITTSGYCLDCWIELYQGKIPLLKISERQLNSAACRVVRKGTEMS
jgi:hypothetical protein